MGDVACFLSKIVLTGRTRLVANVQMNIGDEGVLDGFITFIHVDLEGKPIPHGIEVVPTAEEDIALQEEAKGL